MSKKHKKTANLFQSSSGSLVQSYEGEYRIIKHDLVRVLVLNSVYLAGVLALYFSNLKTHYLENLFTKLFHL